jgi:hypothetical protein
VLIPTGGLKRQAGFAVKWAREVADIQAQIDDLPQGTSCHTETEWKLFDQLVEAKDTAAAWLSKIGLSEHHTCVQAPLEVLTSSTKRL